MQITQHAVSDNIHYI